MIKRFFQFAGKRSHNVLVQYALGVLYGNFALWGIHAPMVIYQVGKKITKMTRKPKPRNGGNDAVQRTDNVGQ